MHAFILPIMISVATLNACAHAHHHHTNNSTTFITATVSPIPAADSFPTANPTSSTILPIPPFSSPSTFTTSTTTSTTSSPSADPNQSSIDPSLVPPFGVTPGVKLNDGTPRCAGLNNKPIGCDCPPSLDTFLASLSTNVANGDAFPTGSSAQDQLTRLNTCIVTLQNFVGGPGSGVGCPAVSTDWVGLQSQLTKEVNG